MTIADRITDIAVKQNGQFTRKDLLKVFCTGKNCISESSLAVLLNRMLVTKRIVRVAYGTYRLNENKKRSFLYKPNDFMFLLNRQIKEKFPFINYCIWQTGIFVSMMQHIPAVKITLVDVERDVMEFVFMFLQGMEITEPILLNPSVKEVERYITNKDVIIIRPLVKESPLDIVDGCPVPTLEKMLVDAISDRELNHLQGNELSIIYTNAFSEYEIKKTRLLRYAARRNRKEKVQQLINTITHDTP